MTRPRRTYTSALRGEQARRTRRRILDAARELFLAGGYTSTTIEQIAAASGVSVQTVYNAIGNKAAVAAGVYDTTLAGDDSEVAIAERPSFQAMLAAPDARRCLGRYAALSRELAERVAPLLAVLMAEAGNPDLRALVERAERQRADGTAAVAHHVADRFGLPLGLTVEVAADILWVLTAPETMSRLVQQRRWTWDRYQAWLADAMTHSLTGRR